MPNNSSIPVQDVQFLEWAGQHAQLFSDNYARIGLDQNSAQAFKALAGDMQSAWTAYQAAKRALTDASDAWKRSKSACRSAASTDVRTIRAYAVRQANPQETYSLAGIPAPKTPNFGVPPGTPTEANVSLDVNTGNLEVRFECNNPAGLSGTVYLVQRRTASASAPTVYGPFTQAAVTSVKRFIDSTITSGTASVQYIITAQRGTIQGRPSNPITVQFGRAGNGPGLAFTVSEDGSMSPIASNVPAPAKSPKLAA